MFTTTIIKELSFFSASSLNICDWKEGGLGVGRSNAIYTNAQIYLKRGAQSGWEWWTDRGSADLRRRLHSTYAIVGGEISLVLHQLLRYPWLKRVLWNMSLERTEICVHRERYTGLHQLRTDPCEASGASRLSYGYTYLLISQQAYERFASHMQHAYIQGFRSPRFDTHYNNLTSASSMTITLLVERFYVPANTS